LTIESSCDAILRPEYFDSAQLFVKRRVVFLANYDVLAKKCFAASFAEFLRGIWGRQDLVGASPAFCDGSVGAMMLTGESDQIKERVVESRDRLVPFGRLLFVVGILLVSLRAMSLATRMPGLPSFWYANQSLWIIIGFVMTAAGWQILWGRSQGLTSGWEPTVPGRRFRSVVLYVGEGCHLCEDAAELLAAYQRWLPQVERIEIDSDPKLSERFCTCIPVVEFDGKIRFRGRVDETLLRRLIEGTTPLAST
jgi:hypothetical protein